MRLKIQDLSNHLKRGLAPLYFIVGEEPEQQNEALNQIRKKALEEGYTERERYEISPQFDWESFEANLSALSLFSSKRMIDARITGNVGKLGARVLVSIANHLPPETVFLFSSDKLESAVAKSAWFTSLERLGIVLWPRVLSRQELKTWILNRVKTLDLNLTEEAIDILIERTEGNLLATRQAITKLGLLSSTTNSTDSTHPQPITKSDILEITRVDTQFSIFDLVDSALLGQILRTKQIFERLRTEGVEPILILWAITREVRAIIPLAQGLNNGRSLPQMIREQNLWSHKQAIYTSFLNRSSIDSLHQCLIQAKDIDNLIKGRQLGDVWSSLLSLCLSLAGAGTGVAYV